MIKNKYIQCKRCVMDTSDPTITFDKNGYCNHCITYFENKSIYNKANEKGKKELDIIIEKIKKDKKGKYDSILGLSGGVDSSYLALKAKELGLNPLIVHFDNGWNSEISVGNIERILNRLNFDLYTFVMDWEQFREMQRAFFKASVMDIEMLTDHAILAIIYKAAKENHIKYILSGENFATEGIMPKSWIHVKSDSMNIKDIVKKNGVKKINNFPFTSIYSKIVNEYITKYKVVKLLNYFDYDRDKALDELHKKLEFQYYGEKHHESVFTKFFQNYYLPQKFGIDKRKAHLSTLICAGKISRDYAIEILKNPLYNSKQELQNDIEYVAKKLNFSLDEFNKILMLPAKSHLEYRNISTLFDYLKRMKRKLASK